jgi:hypothetical protein
MPRNLIAPASAGTGAVHIGRVFWCFKRQPHGFWAPKVKPHQANTSANSQVRAIRQIAVMQLRWLFMRILVDVDHLLRVKEGMRGAAPVTEHFFQKEFAK